MRTVTYGAACSLDGFLAAADGSLDWLHFSSEVGALMEAYWKGVDTVLMGRKTWSDAIARGGGEGAESDAGGISTYVFSRTLTEIGHPGAHLVRGDAGAFVRALKEQPGKGICVMGGGDLARSLLEEGVIDQVELNIHPVLLGTGIPMFPSSTHRTKLQLAESRTLDGGCILAKYRVRTAAAPT